MVLKYIIFRILTNFKTIKNVIGRMGKKTPNFLTYLFGVTPPVRCYPLLRYVLCIQEYVIIHEKSKSTCSRCTGGPGRLLAPPPLLLRWRSWGGGEGKVGEPCSAWGLERGKGNLWQVNLAGHTCGWIWHVSMARHFGRFIWRVSLAHLFSGFHEQ